MKTKVLLTALLLGVSISAACITAREYINPYYPQHIYGGAKLDSVVISRDPAWKTIVLFDNKGRMTLNRSYSLEEETNQWKAEREEGFGYADGMMYTSKYIHNFNLELYQVKYMEGEYRRNKCDNIVYNEKGDPLQFYFFEGNANWWWDTAFCELRYDEAERIVLYRLTMKERGPQAIMTTTEYPLEYVLDEKGRVITQIQNKYFNGFPERREYTYNDHGNIMTEKMFYINGYAGQYWYDEYLCTWVGDSIYTLYVYNAYNNLEEKIQYKSDNTILSQSTYYYSFPSTSEVENAEVTATPDENFSVILQWPAVAGADIYTLDIKKDGELVCTLIFNEQGQLTGISFAPARNGNARKVPTATQTTGGWQYKIEGLEANTKYSYTATAKKNGTVLSTQTVYFTTSLQDIEEVLNADKPVKVQHNGQILILRGEKTYTLQGQEVK